MHNPPFVAEAIKLFQNIHNRILHLFQLLLCHFDEKAHVVAVKNELVRNDISQKFHQVLHFRPQNMRKQVVYLLLKLNLLDYSNFRLLRSLFSELLSLLLPLKLGSATVLLLS